MSVQGTLKVAERLLRPSVANTVVVDLNRQILPLVVFPGMVLSQTDVAQALGVSRQPVRAAWHRLSKPGFPTICPERATTVSLISQRSVVQARFARTAIQPETVRAACERLKPADIGALEATLDERAGTVSPRDADRFHRLDDQFHRKISESAGHGTAMSETSFAKTRRIWTACATLRRPSPSFAAQRAYAGPRKIPGAIRARDPEAAAAAVRRHLQRHPDQFMQIRAAHSACFADET